nr:TPR repeat protein [uncultured bacterium]
MFKAFCIAFLGSLLILVLPPQIKAQADDLCQEFGETPTRESNRGRAMPFVYGRVVLKGIPSDAKPRVVVTYSDTQQPAMRQALSKSGNYCFKKPGSSGTLVIEVDGIEVARKTVADIGSTRQREDFEIFPVHQQTSAPPGVVSTKFNRDPNEQTVDLYRKAAEAEREKHPDKAVEYVKEIVSLDPADFIAWAKLGSLYMEQNRLADAETSFKRSVSARADYTPAILNLGLIKAVQKDFPAAIEIFKRAVVVDPESARAYRLLGEALLQNRQGSLGLAALDEALRIDPIGMAECHLLKARLYDLAGAKNLASHEYKSFLAKVPDHADKKKLEKYIKENPED